MGIIAEVRRSDALLIEKVVVQLLTSLKPLELLLENIYRQRSVLFIIMMEVQN